MGWRKAGLLALASNATRTAESGCGMAALTGNTMKIRLSCIVPLAVLALAAPAHATDSAITAYGAFRSGGDFQNATTGENLKVESSGTGAIALDLPYDGSRQLQLFLSHQRSHLDYTQSAAPKTAATLPLAVTYFHLGGTYFFEGPVGSGPYVVGGLGGTLLALEGDGYGNELRPSMNLGVGYQFMLGKHAALRLEGRFYSTLINSSGGLFCSGSCVLQIQGDLFTQGEGMVGVSVPF